MATACMQLVITIVRTALETGWEAEHFHDLAHIVGQQKIHQRPGFREFFLIEGMVDEGALRRALGNNIEFTIETVTDIEDQRLPFKPVI